MRIFHSIYREKIVPTAKLSYFSKRSTAGVAFKNLLKKVYLYALDLVSLKTNVQRCAWSVALATELRAATQNIESQLTSRHRKKAKHRAGIAADN